ncbi:(R)-mandelonitrile lyase-like protein [Tanacetum coccineum]
MISGEVDDGQGRRDVEDASYLVFTYEATDFTPAQEYDYIIVGGGTAGCPLAATLSQKYSVLLLERGGEDSPAQNFYSEDGVSNTRGRVLGGGSMVNFGFYSRAEDYFYENSGIDWDTKAVESAYEWVEDSIVTRTAELKRWQASIFSALLESGNVPDNGFAVEHIEGTKIAAAGVTYHDSKGQHYEVRVRSGGEVILSAGALGSPQLLLISGVGPAANLSSMRIPVDTLPDAGSVRVAGITEIGPYIESVSVPPLTPPLHFIPFLGSHRPINFSIEVIGTKISRAVATGSLNLVSPSDVTVTPSVRFNYFSNPEDIRQCGNGIEIIRKMLETEALEEYKFPDFNGGLSFRYMGPSLLMIHLMRRPS